MVIILKKRGTEQVKSKALGGMWSKAKRKKKNVSAWIKDSRDTLRCKDYVEFLNYGE